MQLLAGSLYWVVPRELLLLQPPAAHLLIHSRPCTICPAACGRGPAPAAGAVSCCEVPPASYPSGSKLRFTMCG
jgi:hypothetical protein